MLKLGEKSTIGEIQSRFVRNPKEPLPKTSIDMNAHDRIYYQGWNDCMDHLKAVGKI